MQSEPTLSDQMRKQVAVVVNPIGQFLNALGVSPDTITILGLFVVAIGGWRLSEGEWTQALIILGLGLPLDMLDGATARAYGKFRPFGSFLDSTLDRYADGLIFGGIALHFAQVHQFELTALALTALHGAMMVSYIRAKAESLNIECKIGLFDRVVRLLALLFTWVAWMIWGDNAITFGLVVLAVGTQFTAMQRLWYVSRQLEG